MVIGYVPGVVFVPTVNVSAADPAVVTDVGLNPAVTPVGRPAADSAIISALPDTRVVRTELVPVLPTTTDRLAGVAAIEKSLGGGAATVKVRVVTWVAEGAVPVMVIGYVPGAALVPTVRVSVADPAVVTDVGLNPAVTPVGRPAADSAIVSALPDTRVVAMELVPALPTTTDRLAGVAAIEKSLGGGGAAAPTETVSKVAVPSFELLCEVAARPAITEPGIVKVTLELGTAVHVTPSAEV
jgi:hypothetical protein